MVISPLVYHIIRTRIETTTPTRFYEKTMCELCSSSNLEFHKTDSTADAARGALLLDSGITGPSRVADTATPKSDAPTAAQAPETPASPLAKLASTYGLQTRDVNGETEFYFRAGGQDNLVLRANTADAAGLDKASSELKRITDDKVAELERTYKVDFAEPGEFATKSIVENADCKEVEGEDVFSRQPTLPVLYGMEEGLRQAQPAQLTKDGKSGVKIYLLDKQPLPDFYGGRKVQGVYRFEGKDNKPTVFITPAGQALPPTAKDTTPGERTVAWITNHELNHNSQANEWGRETPPELARGMGWGEYVRDGKSYYPFIQGKAGELYFNAADSCHLPSTWFSIHKSGWPLDKNGLPVKTVAEAQKFTNEQVMDLAAVRPSTFYFKSPYEMMAESLTSFRAGADSRANLLRQSPELYRLTEEYDRKELARVYGGSATPNMVRMPDGSLTPRNSESVRAIVEFEGASQQASK